MPRYRVLPYRQGSRGARALADALPRGRVLRLEGSTFVPRRDDVIINWGKVGDIPRNIPVGFEGLINNPYAIRQASNKLEFFRLINGREYCPPFWENRNEIPDDVFPIVCRTVLAGHSGDGIVIAVNRNELVPAPLYVKYIKKQSEYRIHVGKRGEESIIIAVQRKARRLDVPDERVNWTVRNHANGFIYARNDVAPPECVLTAAREALGATGLDFGAVDVIYNERSNRAYVLEINTAPGLEGQTVEDYARFFRGQAV